MRETFESNHPGAKFVERDLSDPPDEIHADVVVGSPPCQGFSDARGNRDEKDARELSRNSLPFSFLEWTASIRPVVAVMENVAGFATKRTPSGGLFLDDFVRHARSCGFDAVHSVIDASSYGVPQHRPRFVCFLTASDLHLRPEFPKATSASPVPVIDALSDLPEPDPSGEVGYASPPSCPFQSLMRCPGVTSTSNHYVVRRPAGRESVYLQRVPSGKVFRSSRFGPTYVGVWDVHRDELSPALSDLLHFIARYRTKSEYNGGLPKYREGGVLRSALPPVYGCVHRAYSDGHRKDVIDLDAYCLERGYALPDTPPLESVLSDAVAGGWLRVQTTPSGPAYDLTTKSGIRPKYRRLDPSLPSPTIMTSVFNVREYVHPTSDRALTPREGARIQSFPDDFKFVGSKTDVCKMVGNAVPPLLATALAKEVARVIGLSDGVF